MANDMEQSLYSVSRDDEGYLTVLDAKGNQVEAITSASLVAALADFLNASFASTLNAGSNRLQCNGGSHGHKALKVGRRVVVYCLDS